jgi:DNA-binding protein Fis
MSDTPRKIQVKPLLELRKEHILHVLQSVDGDLDRASRILGISVASLRRNIKQYELGDKHGKQEGEL